MINTKAFAKIINYVGTYSIPFSFGAVSIMVLDTYVGTTSISDAVSAGANISMAIIAFKAFLVGRNYVDQMTTQEGYKKALSFNNITIPKISKIINIDYNLQILDNQLDHIHSNINIKNKVITLVKVNNSLRTVCESVFSVYFEIRKDISDISSYGIVPKSDKALHLKNLQYGLSKLGGELTGLTSCLDELLRVFFHNYYESNGLENDLKENVSKISLQEDYHMTVLCKKTVEKSIALLLEVRSHYNSYLLSENSHIKNYFTVVEQK
ncbi:hypothetical protein [Pantoea agglomerans]